MKFNESKLYGVSNKKYLSELIHVEYSMLKDVNQHFSSDRFTQLDRKNKERTLFNPNKDYKNSLRRINKMLQRVQPPEYVTGGIKGRSHVSNALIHRENRFFLLLDLKNFFPSTNESYVFSFFNKQLQMPVDISKILTLLVTEPDVNGLDHRHLPQGFPTSPYLSYVCYKEMFDRINKLAEKQRITFSSYYDDLTFSSNRMIDKKFKRRVIQIVKQYGLTVNTKKTKLMINKNGVKVTGAIVKDRELLAPNSLQYKAKERFDILVNHFEQNANSKEMITLCNELQGTLSAIKAVQPKKNTRYMQDTLKTVRKEIKNK